MASSSGEYNNGFPATILLYLKENAPPRLLLKLMKCSRYFCFKEFPFMVVKDIQLQNGRCTQGQNKFNSELLDLGNLTKPLWICNELRLCYTNDYSLFLSKTAVCDVKKLWIDGQRHLKMDDFQFFISSNTVKELINFDSEVQYDDGNIVPVEEIVKLLPNLQHFSWYECADGLATKFTSGSTKKLIEYLNPSTLTSFELCRIQDTFDFELFAKFMDKNPSIHFDLHFRDDLSDEYVKILQAYVDKLDHSDKNCKISIKFRQQYYESIPEDFDED